MVKGPAEASREEGTIKAARRAGRLGVTVVALGLLASRALEKHGVAYVRLVHPAARGRIRKRETYVVHVLETLKHASETARVDPAVRQIRGPLH